MGAETIAAGIVGGSALFGANESRKANKRASREAKSQEQRISEDRAKTQAQQNQLSQKVEQQQRKLAVGQARANRSRLRGGVFGESEPTLRNLSTTLG